jgi:hypothetical protein
MAAQTNNPIPRLHWKDTTPMTNLDQQAIDAHYSASVEKLLGILAQAFTPNSSPADRAQAEQRFQTGIVLAREVRERALTLV